MEPLLMECTVKMLQILCSMLQNHTITHREFVEHTKVKIEFLNSNIEYIPQNYRIAVAEIISECHIKSFRNSEFGVGDNYLNC
jgi:hypothetical protein